MKGGVLNLLSLCAGLALWAAPNAVIIPGSTWILKDSRVSYTVNHPFKKATGVTTKTRGKGRCSAAAGAGQGAKTCEILLAVPVATFDSGDSNRDLHMLEATKGAAFPVITVRAAFDPAQVPLKADLTIEFAGQKASQRGVELRIVSQGGDLTAEGQFVLNLADFAIIRPSLLGLSIDNEVPIMFSSTWKLEK